MGGSGGACAVPYTTRFAMPAESPSRRGTANFWWRLVVGPVLLVTMSTEHNYTSGPHIRVLVYSIMYPSMYVPMHLAAHLFSV